MATKLTTIQKTLYAAKNMENIPVLDAVRAATDDVAVMTKAVTSSRTQDRFDSKNNLTIDAPNVGALRNKSETISRRKQDAENIMSILPDLELTKQVLVSSIRAPKDMITTELTFSIGKDILKPELRAKVLDRLNRYFTETYKIKDLLNDIFEDVLFYSGSHPLVVIPENVVDDLINGASNFSMESLSNIYSEERKPKPLGLLGNSKEKDRSFSLEHLSQLRKRDDRAYEPVVYLESGSRSIDTLVQVTDNYNILKLPMIEERIRAEKSKNMLYSNAYSFESSMKKPTRVSLSDRDLKALIYKGRHKTSDTIRILPTQDQLTRRSVSEPLVQRLPSESVIPVYVPGNEERHVGYFVLLDTNGYPITSESGHLTGSLIKNNMTKPFASSLIDKTKFGMSGASFSCNDHSHVSEMVKTYANILEADLLARLRNGAYGSSVRISSNQEIYRLMLARSLSDNATQMLWVPKELMTYFAVDFDTSGIGRSLLDRSSVIAALRGALLFADVRASIRNSVGQTNLRIKLDEDDPDPAKRIEQGLIHYMDTRQQAIPYDVRSTADLADFITRAGVNVSVEGHEGIPDMETEISETSSNHVQPDGDMQDRLNRYHSMALGVPNEIVDSINQPDFATSVVNNSLMMTKRVIQYQERFNPLISDHCKKVARHSENLMMEITSLLEKNFDGIILTEELTNRANAETEVKDTIVGFIMADILESFVAELTRPGSVSVQNQLEQLESYESMLDTKLDSYFNSEIFNEELVGELGSQVDSIRAVVKAHFMRKYMNDAGLGDEISELFSIDNDDISASILYDEHGRMVKTSLNNYAKFVAEFKAYKENSDAAAQALDVTGEGSSDYSSDDDSEDDDTDEFGSDVDFSEFDTDDTGTDETVEEENPADFTDEDEPAEP